MEHVDFKHLTDVKLVSQTPNAWYATADERGWKAELKISKVTLEVMVKSGHSWERL